MAVYKSPFLHVTVAGGDGMLGSHIVQALVASGRYKVSQLSRRERPRSSPDVQVQVVNYDDPESLRKALEGQDVLVSAVSRNAVLQQIALIDASISAGVQRFIPSHFGGNLQNQKMQTLPNYRDKVAVNNYLHHKAQQSRLTFTHIYTNTLLEWAVAASMLFDAENEVFLYNGGEHAVSHTTLATAAQSVVSVLSRPELTENKSICVHDTLLSGKEILSLLRQIAPSVPWKGRVVDLDKLSLEAEVNGNTGPKNLSVFHVTALKGGFAAGYGNQFDGAGNKLLGLPTMSRPALEELLRTLVPSVHEKPH